MTSAIDPTRPVDGIPASKSDLRANLAAAKAELEHGGFAEGHFPTNYTAATAKVADHLAGIDAALGAAAFTALADTPASYAGQANRYPRVKSDETGLEFVDQAAGGDASITNFTQAGTGAVTRTVQARLRDYVNVKDFGAVGNNSADDTAAINAAIAHALGVASQDLGYADVGGDESWSVSGVGIYFPPGVYRWNSTAINFANEPSNNPHKHITIWGAGPNHTVIRLENNDYFLNIATDIISLTIKEIRFAGNGTWKGLLKGGSGALTRRGYVIDHCHFADFTECAIGHDASDCPFWSIEHCTFKSTAANAICIALGGLSDESRIVHNEFWAYRYAIKNGAPGANIYIKNNWFAGPSSANEADIWLVPRLTDPVIALWGTVIAENKFGNEGHTSGVPRIIVAAENSGSGTSFRNRVHSTSASTGYVVGVHVRDNQVTYAGGEGLSPFIKSWVHGISGWVIGPNMLSHLPSYIMEFDAGVTTDSINYVKQNTIFQPNFMSADSYVGFTRFSNQGWRFNVIDPYALFPGQPVFHTHGGVTDDLGAAMYVNANAVADAFLISATKSATADPYGGTRAATARYSASGGVIGYNLSGTVPTSSPMFVEFDCKIAASQPLTLLNVWIRRGFTLSAREMFRTIVLTSAWQTVRIPFMMSHGTVRNEIQLWLQPGDYTAGTKTDVVIYNPRVYEARQPVNFGHVRTRGSGGWDAPHLVIGVYHLWIDMGGRLRIKSGVPTFDADGAIVGTQA
jgi:Pectate lyase superfamily protein